MSFPCIASKFVSLGSLDMICGFGMLNSMKSVFTNVIKFWFQWRLKVATQALGRIRFNDLPTEDEWNIIQTVI